MKQRMLTFVVVPRGVSDSRGEGKWIRKVKIRRLTGCDEQILNELPASMPVHSKVVALLERISTFDGIRSRHSDMLKKLSIGDRTFLLLSARKLIINSAKDDVGDALWFTTKCPSCGSTMSLNLSTTSLQEQKNGNKGSYQKASRDYGLVACGFKMRIRPLTAEDQDRILKRTSDRNAIVQGLARASIVHAEPRLPEILPEPLLEAVGHRLEEVDPFSDIALSFSCPECKYSFRTSFPAEEFVLRELGTNAQQLEREIHWLAFHYHWSEEEILSLPTSKRKRYVELVNATLAGEEIL